jgi:rare lipoprotein A (peptidoglycan hydrolase)
VRVRTIAADASGRIWYRVWSKGGTGWLASWLTRETRAAPVAATPPPVTDPGWQTAQATIFGLGDGLLGRTMACGATLTDTAMAVAHRSLPCGTHVRLRYGGQVVDAQVLDRGPYTDGITLDLAPAVCQALGNCASMTLEWQVLP